MIMQVWTVSMPVVMLNSPAVSDPALGGGSNPAFGTARDVVGIVLWAVGMAIETVSDAQKVGCLRFSVAFGEKSDLLLARVSAVLQVE
jgi:steroid 5-alpha reductase family enzyme